MLISSLLGSELRTLGSGGKVWVPGEAGGGAEVWGGRRWLFSSLGRCLDQLHLPRKPY
jgi:hypothetical protein